MTLKDQEIESNHHILNTQIKNPERLLVAISPSPLSARLVRAGYRMAQQLNSELLVVYIDNSANGVVSERAQKRINDTMRLAESMGAKVITVTGKSIPETLLAVAKQHQVTKLIIGQTLRSRWQELLGGSIVNQLIRMSDDIDVYVISSSRDDISETFYATQQQYIQWRQYLAGISAVAIATFVGYLIEGVFSLNPTNLVMIYLLAIVVTSIRYGYGVAALVSFLSVVVFNVAFVPPRYTFRVEDAEYIVTFIGLGSVGLTTAYLASQVRRLAVAAQNREQQTARLYAFSQDLAIATDSETISKTLVSHISQILNCEIALFMPEDNELRIQTATPSFQQAKSEILAAQSAFQQGQQSGYKTKLQSDATGIYRPIRVVKQILGVIGIQTQSALSADQERLIDAFLSQYALALEAIQLADKAQEAELLSAKEKLQTTILNSVSHDLRTPLVSVKGALSSLLEDGETLTDAMQKELLLGAFEETDRLNQLVGNLLDMSRLQSGAIQVNREPYAIAEVISVARTQLQSRLKDRSVQVKIQDNLPLINIDLVLFAQALVNLLDNAVKYSTNDTVITIEAFRSEAGIQLDVIDSGVGIPEEEIERIFGKFYRASTVNRTIGSGLGLSIVQGIVELHKGNISVRNNPDGGTIFSITLPLTETLTI